MTGFPIYMVERRYLSKHPKGKRGRPKGWKMPDSVKKKIAKSKTGYSHNVKSRNKTSDSLRKHNRKKKSRADEMLWQYRKNPEACKWLKNNKEAIDADDLLMTCRSIYGITRSIEVPMGMDGFGHDMTPEKMMIMKEEDEDYDY